MFLFWKTKKRRRMRRRRMRRMRIAQHIHCYFQSIPFLKMPQINLSKGLALQSPIVGVASHINRFEHPLILKENQEAEEEEEEEEE